MEETYTENKLRVEEALGQLNLVVVDFLGSKKRKITPVYHTGMNVSPLSRCLT
jgi:hypothetical protein